MALPRRRITLSLRPHEFIEWQVAYVEAQKQGYRNGFNKWVQDTVSKAIKEENK